jgi:hypothetical protein
MNYTFLGLLIAVGVLLLEPGLAPLDVRFKLLLLSTFCLMSVLVNEYWSVR